MLFCFFIYLFRRNSDDGWVTYKGIISNGELIKLIDKSEDKQQDMVRRQDRLSNT